MTTARAPKTGRIGHKAWVSTNEEEVIDELRAAILKLRAPHQAIHRYVEPLAGLLELIATSHPKRRMRVMPTTDTDPPEYCGACQDPPVQRRQWPCPVVSEAIALAEATLGGTQAECGTCHGTPPPGFACTHCGATAEDSAS